MPTAETPAVEGADAPDTAAPEAPTAEVPEWDGQDFDALETQPWWKGVPEKAREHFKTHAERHTFYRQLADSDDAAARLTQEIDGLRKSLGAEVTKYKGEAESWKKKHEDLDTEYKGFRSEVQAAEHERKDAEVKAKYPDIHATWNPEDENRMESAYATFVRMVEHQKIPMDKAAKAVRAMFDMPAPGAEPAKTEPPPKPKTREVEPPDSVTLAAKDGMNPADTSRLVKPLDYAEARRRELAKADEEEGLE